jgi:Fungal specific transcription factor domain
MENVGIPNGSSNQQPMSQSPTSVADSFELDLDNTKSLELLEFGTVHLILADLLGGVSLFSVISDLGSVPAVEKSKNAVSGSAASPPIPHSPTFLRAPMTGGRVIRSCEELSDDNYSLPERSVAGMLVDLYFKYVDPLYPFVYEAKFRQTLEETYNRKHQFDGTKDRTKVPWLALLNLVLAFGSDYVDLPLEKTHSLSQLFGSRGNELIISVCFEIGSLEVLQALLLLSIHLLTNMQLNRCWVSVGCLLRTAQGLGLHLDPTKWNIPPLEKEMRKRLWWGIYSLDRYLIAL